MAKCKYVRAGPKRVRLTELDRKRMRDRRLAARYWPKETWVDETWEEGNERIEREERVRLLRHRNVQAAVMCLCLLERVAIDPFMSRECGYTVIEKMEGDFTTSPQGLYAGMLLKSVLEQTPEIEDKVRAELRKLKWEDGTTAWGAREEV